MVPYEGNVITRTIREKSNYWRACVYSGTGRSSRASVEAEVSCTDVLQVISSVRGPINGLIAEVTHTRCHVSAPPLDAKERAEATNDLIEVVHAYLK
jgi:DNA-binding FrmR family transcriptional regulator